MAEHEDNLQRYLVRFSPCARDDVVEIGWRHFELTQDATQGQDLIQAIYQVAAGLAILPQTIR